MAIHPTIGGLNIWLHRESLQRNARFYIVTMRNYTQRHERAVLHEKLRKFSFTQRRHETFSLLNILLYINPTNILEDPLFLLIHIRAGDLRLWGSGSLPLSKLWQSPLDGRLSNNRETKYLASPRISWFTFFLDAKKYAKYAKLHRSARFFISPSTAQIHAKTNTNHPLSHKRHRRYFRWP